MNKAGRTEPNRYSEQHSPLSHYGIFKIQIISQFLFLTNPLPDMWRYEINLFISHAISLLCLSGLVAVSQSLEYFSKFHTAWWAKHICKSAWLFVFKCLCFWIFSTRQKQTFSPHALKAKFILMLNFEFILLSEGKAILNRKKTLRRKTFPICNRENNKLQSINSHTNKLLLTCGKHFYFPN